MTEEQWAVSADPAKVLEWLHKRASTRKARLYAVACFAHTWDLWRNSPDWKTIPTLERLADGKAIEADRKTPEASLIAPVDSLEDLLSTECILHIPDSILDSDFTCREAYCCVNQIVAEAKNAPTSYEGCEKDLRRELSELLRCIFGNPFRAVSFDARWRTLDVMGLAHAIYEDKVFDRMPILADSLMDADCEDKKIIAHCKDGLPHAKRCWVVDLILGKEMLARSGE